MRWEFSFERSCILRVDVVCQCCEMVIDAGVSMRQAACLIDGEFDVNFFHVECRKAELAWNRAASRMGLGFCRLWQLHDVPEEPDFMPVIARRWPMVAERLERRAKRVTPLKLVVQ